MSAPPVEADAVDAYTSGGAWSYRWLCAPAPCAVEGSPLADSLLRLGGGVSWSDASSLTFSSSDLNANVSLVFVAERSLSQADDAAPAREGSHSRDASCVWRPQLQRPRFTVGASARQNANDRLTMSAQPLDGTDPLSPQSFMWSADASLAIPPANGWSTERLVLMPHAFGPGGGAYTMWLSARESTTGRLGGACKIVSINVPPLGGSIDVQPTRGVSMQTEFLLTASGWSDEADDRPSSSPSVKRQS